MCTRLTDKHPTKQKLDKLFKYMDELGIRFEAINNQGIYIVDKEFPSNRVMLLDIEESIPPSNPSIEDIPPMYDYKLGKLN